MNVSAADIGNAYLNAKCAEKVHVTCGPELFGAENEGKTSIIVRALYGLKSAGASWRAHLSIVIQDQLGYKSTKADPDIYEAQEGYSGSGVLCQPHCVWVFFIFQNSTIAQIHRRFLRTG